MILKVILEPSDEGGFTAYVPTLPGCISEGETKDEAMENIREAIELYLVKIDYSGPQTNQTFDPCPYFKASSH
jgi:predicted RNase H-like HicB family nuclease